MGAGTNKGMRDVCKQVIYFEQKIQPNIYCDQADSLPQTLIIIYNHNI